MKRVPGRSSAARAIHLNPVRVSAYRAPAAAAILASIVEDTTVDATSLFRGAASAAVRSRGPSGVPVRSSRLAAGTGAAAPTSLPRPRKSRYSLAELMAQCDVNSPLSAEDHAWIDAPAIGREA